jgi:adenosine deaminase
MRWYPHFSTGQLRYFRQIPKVELHRHLEGSLRIETLVEVAQEHGMDVPDSRFHALVQMQKDDALNFDTFLSKFHTLRQFYRSPEVIARITQEAVEDAAQDNIQYMEMRFTPMALARLQGYSLAEVMDWVIESGTEKAQETGLKLRLIASVNRHETVELAEEVTRLAVERMDRGVVALDLAGNEAQFSALPFVGVFREARQSGLHVTIHAGEWGSAENVRLAIEALGAERIGHGVRIMEEPKVVDLARERGTVFEVCVTSNYQSGVVPALKDHPLVRMIHAGLKTTINTDDPGISAIALSDEYRLVLEELGLPASELANCVLNGARSAFVSAEERRILESNMRPALVSALKIAPELI